MKFRYIEREQFLPISLEEAWSFFSDPKNLSRITLADMRFRITEPFDGKPMFTGQRITYTLRPVLGVPVKWVTLIEQCDAPYRFIDTQLHGPFTRWWHLHTFSPVEGGVLMKDRVEYILPLGPLGDLAHRIFVRRKVERIFDHRSEVLKQLFPKRAA